MLLWNLSPWHSCNFMRDHLLCFSPVVDEHLCGCSRISDGADSIVNDHISTSA
jgi:hypothetical protein